MLENRIERLKLGGAIMVVGFIFWAILVNPTTQIGRYFEAGETKAVLGATDEKEDNLIEGAVSKSDDFLGLIKAGQKFLEEGKYSLARATFARAVELRSNYRDAYYLLGYSYLKLYEQTGDYLSDNPDPYVDLTNLEKARLALLKARSLDPLSEKIPLLLEKAGL